MASARPWSSSLEVPSPIAKLLGETYAQNGSLVMAERLQSHRSSLAAASTYFKSWHGPASGRAARPGETAELAALRKKAGAMGRDFQSLLLAHERQEAAMADLRQKVRQMRGAADERDKALHLARRTVERLSEEKAQLEAAAAGTQAYVRKLEGRLLAVRHAAELEARCSQLKAQLDQQAHAAHEAAVRAAAAEEAHQKAQLDVACLKRGLELAAEQLTRSTGAEVPSTLLRAVARGQEEALGLSVQLSDAKQQVSQLAAALEQARTHMHAQQTALAQAQQERQELAQRAEAAEAAAEKQRAASSELRRVLDALRPKAGALAGERDSLLQQLELERTAAADAQKEVKHLRGALRQKATIEAALRDELRRLLAGEGASPSPLAKHALPPSSARRAAAAGGDHGRGDSRAGSRSRQQARPGAAAAAGTPPAKHAGSGAGLPGAVASSKAVMRQSSAWEQQQHAAEHHWLEGGEGEGLVAAEPSPMQALRRLQEQRRQQQGSQLGVRRQPERQQRQGAEPSWDDAVAGWQLQAGGGMEEAGWAAAAAPSTKLCLQAPTGCGALGGERGSGLLSPPSTGSPHKRGRSVAAAAATAAQVLPVQDSRLMQLYSSALDEQIAMLEGDLAELGGGAPSPIARLQKQAALAAGAARAPGAGGATAVGKPAPPQAVQEEAGAQRGGTLGAWRPNGAFEAGAADGPLNGHNVQHVAADGASMLSAPAPSLWHSNPLAGSPPPKPQLRLQLKPAQHAAEPAAAGATTVRALPDAHSGAGVAPQAAEPAAAVAVHGAAAASTTQPLQAVDEEDEWRWEGSAAASSPSLRLPASEPNAQQPACSEGSCGGAGGGVASLSRHWDLPSPAGMGSDWLSNGEADIEQLEVTSTPVARRSATPAGPSDAGSPAQRPASGWASGWGDSGGDGESVIDEGAPLVPQYGSPGMDQHQQQQEQQYGPFLPGLPLVAASPQHSAPLLGEGHVDAAQQQQQQQKHTLFDLAGMSLSDLMTAS